MVQDRFNRTIDYLRISVIDHCNLRCVYCMPLSGVPLTPSADLLRPDEIERVVRAAAALGFRKIRLTGGEPTLRADLADIVRQTSAVPGIREVSMTTNGVLLPRVIDELKAAGLARVNLHIDSLDPERFSRTMRLGTLADAWASVAAVERAGLTPVKINAVVTRGFNDADVVDLAALTLEHDWHVRFIELMPFGVGECAQMARTALVTTAESMTRIEAALGRLEPLEKVTASEESVNYRLPGARGVVGFISPVSEPYCGDCNRMRLTADGRLHLCLLHDDEIDLRQALRSGASQSVLEDLLRQAVEQKPVGHSLSRGISTRQRDMVQIGG
ncbi:MAG TPA: GTP 3',8-cyclase MoaA [Phycisphaerae bacterium]|nr:GTP 3',8-cyclase MoaA [Phycisphaerales bacterium]HRX84470.1 GTP 3',8-cyclase MoaA [Phycisphaerae bacterium]